MVPGNNPTAEDGAGSSATTPIADSSAAQVAGFSSWWTASSIGNFLRQDSSSSGGNCPENSHFVGTTTSQPAISPITPSSRQNPSTESPIVHDVNTEEQEICDVDAEEQNICDARTDKRLNWMKDEDIRLASAWLNNSKDPVAGNERKLDLYWSDVTKEYNQNTESKTLDLNEEASTSTVQAATFSHGQNPGMEEVLQRNTTIRDRGTYKDLQSDLIEHIWHKFGNLN